MIKWMNNCLLINMCGFFIQIYQLDSCCHHSTGAPANVGKCKCAPAHETK